MSIWESLYKQLCDIGLDAIAAVHEAGIEMPELEQRYDAVIAQEPALDLLSMYNSGPWRCPKCRSAGITSSQLNAEHDIGTAKCHCNACGVHWIEHWVLANITIIEKEQESDGTV